MVERPAIITEDEGVAARRPPEAESAAMAKKLGFSLQSRQRGDKGGSGEVEHGDEAARSDCGGAWWPVRWQQRRGGATSRPGT
jgi:hypothetical protein